MLIGRYATGLTLSPILRARSLRLHVVCTVRHRFFDPCWPKPTWITASGSLLGSFISLLPVLLAIGLRSLITGRSQNDIYPTLPESECTIFRRTIYRALTNRCKHPTSVLATTIMNIPRPAAEHAQIHLVRRQLLTEKVTMRFSNTWNR